MWENMEDNIRHGDYQVQAVFSFRFNEKVEQNKKKEG